MWHFIPDDHKLYVTVTHVLTYICCHLPKSEGEKGILPSGLLSHLALFRTKKKKIKKWKKQKGQRPEILVLSCIHTWQLSFCFICLCPFQNTECNVRLWTWASSQINILHSAHAFCVCKCRCMSLWERKERKEERWSECRHLIAHFSRQPRSIGMY